MSGLLEAFDDLLDAQEEALGQRVTATVGDSADDLDCIVSAGNSDIINLPGGMGIAGGYTLQMRKSDFETKPALGDSVTVSCYDDDRLELTSTPEEAGGIYTLRVGDISAENG